MTSAEYSNENRGSLFKNDRKENDGDRDYSGSINVGGVEYWLSGWKKTSTKTGATFLSLSVKPKNESTTDKKPVAAKRGEEVALLTRTSGNDMLPADLIARAKAVPIECVINARGIKLRGKIERVGPCPKCGGDRSLLDQHQKGLVELPPVRRGRRRHQAR